MKWLIFLPLFLVSCIDQPVTGLFSTSGEARDQLRDRVRSRSLSDSSERCSESERCKETCEDMYLKATDLDRCYDSPESRVKVVSEVFEVLINPSRLSELNDIEDKDFSHFLNIGYRGFLDLIDPVHRDEDGDRRNEYWEDIHAYDSDSAQLVLEWIANRERIARTIVSKDDDLDIIRHLFCIAGRSVSEEEQREYICDLWGVSESDCSSDILNSDGMWTPPNIDNHWSITLEDSDPPSRGICHDNPASIYIGLVQGEYDDVGFSTYAEAQDNDNAVEMATDLIAEICGSSLLCAQFYLCPILVEYKGYELDSLPLQECSLYKEALDFLRK
ncbi:MAG: hypothetical protein OXK80_02110 [Bdellovibrionales bacterium]|nr:hypothetical protein [Bdellovibrionales bacterium]